MTIFTRTPRSDLHHLIETTVRTRIGRSLLRYSFLMLRSPFPATDNNNSEYSNQLDESSYWQTTIQRIFL